MYMDVNPLRVWRIWGGQDGLRSGGRPEPDPDGGAGAEDDGHAADDGGPGQGLAQQEAGPADAQHGLDELDLADLGHGADGQAAVPGEEAEEHAHHAEVGERRPLDRGGRRRLLGHGDHASNTISGDARTSAQEMVCQEPSSRASRPPSA